MNEVILIVDQYRLREKVAQQGRKQNPVHEAQVMGQMANAFGRHPEKVAIVDTGDTEGLAAYSQAQYKLELMNGNRLTEINEFISKKQATLEAAPPRELIVVTDDPTFQFLMNSVCERGKTALKVWVPGKEIPSPYDQAKYNARLLREVLPELKVPRVDIRLDFENLYLGLKQRGWTPNVKELVTAVSTAVNDLGEITRIVAYADWEILQREDRSNWQRQLAEIGIETRYLVNERGKNTADMKIADEIRNLVERESSAPDAAEIVVVATNDRDFRTVLETAKQRGQRVVLLGIRGGLSKFLHDVVKEGDIRYIDDHLQLGKERDKSNGTTPTSPPHANDACAEEIMRVAVWLSRQGERGWHFAPLEQMANALDPNGAQTIKRLLQKGLLMKQKRQTPQGTVEVIALDRSKPLTAAVEQLAKWAPQRVAYCLEVRGMPYIDTNYLAKGMQLDKTLQRLDVGQRRYDAEKWLRLLAKAGGLVAQELEHAESGKTITTWWLPTENSEGRDKETEPSLADTKPAEVLEQKTDTEIENQVKEDEIPASPQPRTPRSKPRPTNWGLWAVS